MSNYRTIQKLAETTGVHESLIRQMIKQKILSPCKIPGFKRIFIDIQEFDSKMKIETSSHSDTSINIDDFLIS